MRVSDLVAACGSALELYQPTDLNVRNEDHPCMFVEERRESLQDGLYQFFRNRDDDHDQHRVFVEHQVSFMESVSSLSGQVADNGVSGDSGSIKEVRGELLMSSLEDDLDFFQWAEIETVHAGISFMAGVEEGMGY